MQEYLLLVDLLEHSSLVEKQLSLANKLYMMDDYLAASTIYKEYLDENKSDTDVLHNYACSLFMQGRYHEAITHFREALALIRSYHAIYHFFASILYCNRGLIYRAIKHNDQAQTDFMRSEFLYHDNKIAHLCIHNHAIEPRLIPQDILDILIYNNQKSINLCVFTSHMLAKHATEAIMLHKRAELHAANLIYDYVIKQLDEAHTHYHCMLARQLMNCGICFTKIGLPDVGLFNCKLALETESSNPDNVIIQKCISELYELIV